MLRCLFCVVAERVKRCMLRFAFRFAFRMAISILCVAMDDAVRVHTALFIACCTLALFVAPRTFRSKPVPVLSRHPFESEKVEFDFRLWFDNSSSNPSLALMDHGLRYSGLGF